MKIIARDFDLPLSLGCGQAFGWQREGKWFFGFVEGKPIAVRQRERVLEWTGPIDRAAVSDYFRLDDPLQSFARALSRDPAMRPALKRTRGLRLLRQDPWECSVSFICASYANIPRITKMLENLRRRFGKNVKGKGIKGAGGMVLRSFPVPAALAAAPLKELGACGLGYRARYVREFARAVKEKEVDLGLLKKLPYAEAKAKLMEHAGIGEKVADCILLFSLDHLEAFPVDVWIRRIMLKHYAKQIAAFARNPRKISDQEIRAFAQAHFGPIAGYAQQVLYAERKSLCRPSSPG